MNNLNNYTNQLIALLPTGGLWEKLSIARLFRPMLEVIGAELLRADNFIKGLINKLMPDKTGTLSIRWGSVLSLPDPCTGELPTRQQRVAAIINKLSTLGVERGSLSKQYYIDLAARYGYAITITVLATNSWQVNAPVLTATYFRAGVSRAGEPVATSGNALLQCIINKAKPAHTTVTYNFY